MHWNLVVPKTFQAIGPTSKIWDISFIMQLIFKKFSVFFPTFYWATSFSGTSKM